MSVTPSEARPAAAVVSGSALEARKAPILAAILCAPLISFLNTIGLVPFLPVVAGEMGTSVAALGQVTALSMVFATALGLLAGQFADRYGYRQIMVARPARLS